MIVLLLLSSFNALGFISVWTCNTMLNQSGKSGHLCLAPDLRGKASSFSPLSMMLYMYGVVYVIFIMLRYIPSMSTLLRRFSFLTVNGY